MDNRRAAYLGIILSIAVLSMSVSQAEVNTLGQLNCASNEIAIFDGAGWVCADVPEQQQEAIDALTARLDTLENENQALADRLACVSNTSNDTELVFEGCNVHVRNGVGATDSFNGFGNFIVGYNEDGFVTKDRTGSHNLVVGERHTYSSYGGLVVGLENSVTGINATVSGGRNNEASGDQSSVSGGNVNTASGGRSSVSGGSRNTASGDFSSVSGGLINEASGIQSSILGGNSQSTSTTADTIPALP